MTDAAIVRTVDHQYFYGGMVYPGVTGLLKVLDKSDALMGWAARQTAEAAVALMETPAADGQPTFRYLLDTVGPEGLIKAMTSRSAWKRDEAASLGSEVHAIADVIVSGGDTGFLKPSVLERVERYREWWAASGWKLRLSEALIVHTKMGYGGTFDLLAYDRDGRTVLADIKTGKGIYKEAVLQLAAYGAAEFVAPVGSPVAYPMPAVDRYVILHVTDKGVREVEVAVGALEHVAWSACMDLSTWVASMKGKRL